MPGSQRSPGCMVRTVIRGIRPTYVLCAILALAPVTAVMAGGGGGGSGPQPGPSSEGTGAVTHGKLVSGAGGTYLPILPADITPTGSDPRNPLGMPPPGPNPQGMTCPESLLFHVGPGSPSPGGGVIAALSIHPGFAKNDGGGYDGYDAQYQYSVANAIPAGGNAALTAPGKSRDRSECRRPRDRGHGIPAHTGYLGGRTTGRTIRWELPGSDLLVQPALPRGRCSTAGAADHRPQQSTVSDRGQSRRGSDKVVGSRRHRCAPGRRRDVADVCAHPHLRLDRVRQCRWPRSHTTR